MAHRSPFNAASSGASAFRRVVSGGLEITSARFPPGARLVHIHRNPVLSVVVTGDCGVETRRRGFACPAASVVAMPGGEKHTHDMGTAGALVLAIGLTRSSTMSSKGWARLVEFPRSFSDQEVVAVARATHRVLTDGDVASAVAVEASAVDLLHVASASTDGHTMPTPPWRGPGARPVWLNRAIEMLTEQFDQTMTIAEIAGTVGVHPVHLARVFRAYLGVSPTRYRHLLRIEWAARQLRETGLPVRDLARRAGFADQSHFTRFFQRQTGLTPARYRRVTSAS